MQLLYEAARQASQQASSVAGGGTAVRTTPIVVQNAESFLVRFPSRDTETWQLFVVSYGEDSVTFSTPINTGISIADYDDSSRYPLQDSGYLITITVDNGDTTAFFIDAVGTLVEKIDIGNGDYKIMSGNGYVTGVFYRNPRNGIVTLKYWSGDRIYTSTYNNVDGNSFDFNYFSLGGEPSDCTIDGTFSFYYTETLATDPRVFLGNAVTGVNTEITQALRIDGAEYDSGILSQQGNYIGVFFRHLYETSIPTGCSYNIGENTITVPTGTAGTVRIGQQVIGPITDPRASYVIAIDELNDVITVSEPSQTVGADAGVLFTKEFCDVLRIFNTDGTYTDIDTSEVNATVLEAADVFGASKIVIKYESGSNLIPQSFGVYNHETQLFNSISYDAVEYPGWEWNVSAKIDFVNEFGDPGATEYVYIMVKGDSTFDGKMNRYDAFKFIWTNLIGSVFYEHTIDIGVGETFGWKNSTNYNYYYPSVPGSFYCNPPGAAELYMLFLNNDGTVYYENSETTYADAGSYFENVPLGSNFILFTHYDNSRTLPDNKIQFFGIWDSANNGWVQDEKLWTTTNNGWSVNYASFYMENSDDDLTYYWNSAMATAQGIRNFAPGYIEAYQLDFNTGSAYKDYHKSGNTVLITTTTEGKIFTSTELLDFTLAQGIWGRVDLNENYILNVWQDSENGNKHVIDLYDYEGNLLQSILTDNTAMNSTRIVNNRIYVDIEGTPQRIWALTADSYTLYAFDGYSFSEADNDMR
jgi:hypothetical protein